MRTTTDLPVRSLVTKTREPKGKLLCAAVRAWVLNRSPLAVRLPWKPGPYQDAWMGLASAAEIAPHTLRQSPDRRLEPGRRLRWQHQRRLEPRSRRLRRRWQTLPER